ncbi:MAG: hypothetical protein JW787_09915 [Sedimentisphaerales bacterium]|nr:hypothetical protein [Sedimentisphaerales bacterium]
MFEYLDKELMEIREKFRIRQKLLADIERTAGVLFEKREKLKDLGSVLNKENDDVKKLEGLSLTGLFHFVLGDKDLHLEKERQEFLAAKLKYDECKYSVSALEREIEGFKTRIAAIGEIDEKYKTLIKKKEQLISQSDNENLKKMIELSESIADAKLDMKELKEAISAGRIALNGLDQIISSLKSAKNWGAFDMLGGGLISTAMKHSKINNAREFIHEVQQQLRIFRRELADVDTKTDIKIEIDSFSTFADYFFDGLISDWVVQSKINKSLESALRVSEMVNVALMRLQYSYKDTQEKYNIFEKEKRELIEQA